MIYADQNLPHYLRGFDAGEVLVDAELVEDGCGLNQREWGYEQQALDRVLGRVRDEAGEMICHWASRAVEKGAATTQHGGGQRDGAAG